MSVSSIFGPMTKIPPKVKPGTKPTTTPKTPPKPNPFSVAAKDNVKLSAEATSKSGTGVSSQMLGGLANSFGS